MAVATTADKAEAILSDQALAEENLLDELENEEIPAHIREARLDSLRRQAEDFKNMKEKDHGIYTELKDEKSFFDLTTAEERCVVHFFHPDFRRCSLLDTHLEKLSKKHFETKFAKISVETAKFLVLRLKIQVLPSLICFKGGKVTDRMIGFEELGNADSFTTEALEKWLAKAGAVAKSKEDEEHKNKSIFGGIRRGKDDDSSDDDDY